MDELREAPVARVSDVSVGTARHAVLHDVSLEIGEGEIVGVVGETGSGKTTLGLTFLGHARAGLRITAGKVWVAGQEVLAASPSQLRRVRGAVVSYVPQDAGTALDPVFRLGAALDEVLTVHGMRDGAQRQQRVLELMADVHLPADPAFLRRYPHQLSGGQQQRFAIAIAFANRPRLVVMDEPTTGLDVLTQARILETIEALRTQHGTAILLVSHDIAMLSDIADRLVVMYAGRIVESGPLREVLATPGHPYTAGLLTAIPDRHAAIARWWASPATLPRSASTATAATSPLAAPMRWRRARLRLRPLSRWVSRRLVRCLRRDEVAHAQRRWTPAPAARAPSEADALLAVDLRSARHGATVVLAAVRFGVSAGSCLALVGESGSGKTTLARVVAGLHSAYEGDDPFRRRTACRPGRQRSAGMRQTIQYVFQNPYSSLTRGHHRRFRGAAGRCSTAPGARPAEPPPGRASRASASATPT